MIGSRDTVLEIVFYLACAALLILTSAFHWKFWPCMACVVGIGWMVERSRISKARPAISSQRMMAGAAVAFGFYAIEMFILGNHVRDALWALVVCFALAWGAIKHKHNGRQRLTLDPRSQFRLN
ncbi:MAG: hypothetical protein ACRD4X_18465 [Candidatus Acidiferrales bacterium]